MRRIALLLVTMGLQACAAQPSNPVAISQPGDAELTCSELATQKARNRAKAQQLAGADEDVVDNNVAAGVASAVFWPAMFAMDLSNTAQIELRALQDRNETLSRLEQARGC